jgi:hypothetical protein
MGSLRADAIRLQTLQELNIYTMNSTAQPYSTLAIDISTGDARGGNDKVKMEVTWNVLGNVTADKVRCMYYARLAASNLEI